MAGTLRKACFLEVWAAAKSCMMRNGQVGNLWVEAEILGPKDDWSSSTAKFDKDVFGPVQDARSKANGLVVDDMSSTAIKSCLLKKVKDLVMLDPSFEIEAKFWSMLIGPHSAKLLYDKVDSLLPGRDGGHVTKTALVQQLEKLAKSGLAKFVDQGARAMVEEFAKTVRGILGGVAPSLKVNATEVFEESCPPPPPSHPTLHPL